MFHHLKQIIEKYNKILRYLFCSCISTVFDTIIVWTLLQNCGIPLVTANTIGILSGFVISYTLSANRVFAVKIGATSFAVYFCTFIMGLILADTLIVFSHNALIPFFSESLSFLISKGISIVVPFFFMYFIRKYTFLYLNKRSKTK